MRTHPSKVNCMLPVLSVLAPSLTVVLLMFDFPPQETVMYTPHSTGNGLVVLTKGQRQTDTFPLGKK